LQKKLHPLFKHPIYCTPQDNNTQQKGKYQLVGVKFLHEKMNILFSRSRLV